MRLNVSFSEILIAIPVRSEPGAIGPVASGMRKAVPELAILLTADGPEDGAPPP